MNDDGKLSNTNTSFQGMKETITAKQTGKVSIHKSPLVVDLANIFSMRGTPLSLIVPALMAETVTAMSQWLVDEP